LAFPAFCSLIMRQIRSQKLESCQFSAKAVESEKVES